MSHAPEPALLVYWEELLSLRIHLLCLWMHRASFREIRLPPFFPPRPLRDDPPSNVLPDLVVLLRQERRGTVNHVLGDLRPILRDEMRGDALIIEPEESLRLKDLHQGETPTVFRAVHLCHVVAEHPGHFVQEELIRHREDLHGLRDTVDLEDVVLVPVLFRGEGPRVPPNADIIEDIDVVRFRLSDDLERSIGVDDGDIVHAEVFGPLVPVVVEDLRHAPGRIVGDAERRIGLPGALRPLEEHSDILLVRSGDGVREPLRQEVTAAPHSSIG